MATRRKAQKGSHFTRNALFGGVACCLLAAGIGFGVASARVMSSDDVYVGLSSSAAFHASISVSSDVARDAGSTADDTQALGVSLSEKSLLGERSTCDISAGVQAIIEEREAEQRAAEEAARIAEENHISEVQSAQQSYAGASSLSEVDWSVGKTAFLAEWTARIDAYLAGSALAGYGSVFAEAAWEYGVDPRWSPAISTIESGKGTVCFLSHNAWGWGSSSWSNWTDAIWAHVAGLAENYGYGITAYAAAKYCPPNSVNWYNNTLSEMTKI